MARGGMTGEAYYLIEQLFSWVIRDAIQWLELDQIAGMVAGPHIRLRDQGAILGSAPFMNEHPELRLANTWQMWMRGVYLYLVCRAYEERWQPPIRTTTNMQCVASVRRAMGFLLQFIRAEGSIERPTYFGSFLLSAQRTAEMTFRLHHGFPLDCNLWALYYCNIGNIPYDLLPGANVHF